MKNLKYFSMAALMLGGICAVTFIKPDIKSAVAAEEIPQVTDEDGFLYKLVNQSGTLEFYNNTKLANLVDNNQKTHVWFNAHLPQNDYIEITKTDGSSFYFNCVNLNNGKHNGLADAGGDYLDGKITYRDISDSTDSDVFCDFETLKRGEQHYYSSTRIYTNSIRIVSTLESGNWTALTELSVEDSGFTVEKIGRRTEIDDNYDIYGNCRLNSIMFNHTDSSARYKNDANGEQEATFIFDLQEEKNIECINFLNGHFGNTDFMNYTAEYSVDKETWLPLNSITNYDSGLQKIRHESEFSVTMRYLRLTDQATPSWIGFRHIDFVEARFDVDYIEERKTTYFGGAYQSIANLFDNNDDTGMWLQEGYKTLTFDITFKEETTINDIRYFNGHRQAADQGDFMGGSIQYKNTENNYVDITTFAQEAKAVVYVLPEPIITKTIRVTGTSAGWLGMRTLDFNTTTRETLTHNFDRDFLNPIEGYLYDLNQVVDGNDITGTCINWRFSPKSGITLDLGQEQVIHNLYLLQGDQNYSTDFFNQVRFLYSVDGTRFYSANEVCFNGAQRVYLDLDAIAHPVLARYIRVESSSISANTTGLVVREFGANYNKLEYGVDLSGPVLSSGDSKYIGENKSFEYTGSNIEPHVAIYSASEYTVTYYKEGNEEALLEAPKELGEYVMKVSVVGNEYYLDTVKTHNFTIKSTVLDNLIALALSTDTCSGDVNPILEGYNSLADDYLKNIFRETTFEVEGETFTLGHKLDYMCEIAGKTSPIQKSRYTKILSEQFNPSILVMVGVISIVSIVSYAYFGIKKKSK